MGQKIEASKGVQRFQINRDHDVSEKIRLITLRIQIGEVSVQIKTRFFVNVSTNILSS